MKIIILTLIPLFALASSDSLNTTQYNSIHDYNNRPATNMQKRIKMHRLHKIDEEEAMKIAQKHTNEKVLKLRLTHKSNKLFYHIHTKSYELDINALNGEIITKKELIN
jgi:uncharacterized membrane protein YkoI